jgi:hypothetical protein
MNIEYVGFPGLGFQGKNLYVMFLFSIVSFLFVEITKTTERGGGGGGESVVTVLKQFYSY